MGGTHWPQVGEAEGGGGRSGRDLGVIVIIFIAIIVTCSGGSKGTIHEVDVVLNDHHFDHLMMAMRCCAVTYPLFSSSNWWKIWSRTWRSR